ncbi:MAG: thioester reductase-like protein [Myxococcota bacterium]
MDSYVGKTVLVTGTSGFVGKVWLAMMLDRVQDIGKLIIVLRKKGLRPVSNRFEKILNSSPVFKPLHEKFGADLARFISDRVEIVEGDISKPNFGTDDVTAARLQKESDLVINCAGLVDFNPDVRMAIGSNIDGAVYAADFAVEAECPLVHVSTCYVQGRKDGRVDESITIGYTPTGEEMDPQVELDAMRAVIAKVEAAHATPEAETELVADVRQKIIDRDMDKDNETLFKNMLRRERGQKLKKALATIGTERADKMGWPNTYTWSKSLAEQLLARRAEETGLAYTVLRPAIVESSRDFPFAGWNEGFNTSGPVVYVLGTYVRHMPCREDVPFDVIPVDMVCNSITIAGAAVMAGTHRPVYHAASSGRNGMSIKRAVELTALGHRQQLRKSGGSAMDRIVRSRFDCRTSAIEHPLALPRIQRTARSLSKTFRNLPKGLPKGVRAQGKAVAKAAELADKQLKGVQKVFEVFQPFIHDHRWIFESDAMNTHNVVEPEFQFNPESIDWRSYWLDVHVPGLYRWTFPTYEGKAAETYTPAVKFKLAAPKAAPRKKAAGGR